MSYIKTTWTESTLITTINMNNLERQYDEGYASASSHNHDDRYYTKTECDAFFWCANNDGFGSGCDADMLFYSGGNKHYSDFGVGGIQPYIIIMWDSVELPPGWLECNGAYGTPDLRDSFVLGAGGGYSVGANGGANTWTQSYTITVAQHALTVAELPAHTHTWIDNYSSSQDGSRGGDAQSSGSYNATAGGNTAYTGNDWTHGHPGSYVTQDPTENKPPCVALRFIMKMT